MEALATAMGLELSLVEVPFAELLASVESGRADLAISGLTMTPERNARVAFAGPYFVSGMSVLSRSPEITEVEDPDALDLAGRRYAAVTGSTSERFIGDVLPRAQLVDVGDYDAGIQMVIDGKVDALFADHLACARSRSGATRKPVSRCSRRRSRSSRSESRFRPMRRYCSISSRTTSPRSTTPGCSPATGRSGSRTASGWRSALRPPMSRTSAAIAWLCIGALAVAFGCASSPKSKGREEAHGPAHRVRRRAGRARERAGREGRARRDRGHRARRVRLGDRAQAAARRAAPRLRLPVLRRRHGGAQRVRAAGRLHLRVARAARARQQRGRARLRDRPRDHACRAPARRGAAGAREEPAAARAARQPRRSSRRTAARWSARPTRAARSCAPRPATTRWACRRS